MGRLTNRHSFPLKRLVKQFLNQGLIRHPLSLRDQPAGNIFHVLSYDRFVLSAANAINGSSLIVISHHLADISKAAGHGLQQKSDLQPTQFNTQTNGLSLSEAIALAKEVLRQGRHTSSATALHQKDLRPRMGQKAAKIQGDTQSASLITRIVQSGMSEGWLRRESRGSGQSGYEFIWLVDPNPKSEGGQIAINDHPMHTLRESASDSVPPGFPSIVSAVPVVVGMGVTPDRASLSKQMEDILRRLRIGTHPRTRNFLFNAFQQALSSGEPLPLPKLRPSL